MSFELPSGTVRAHRFGPTEGRPIVCVPGISANSRSYDFLATELSALGRPVIAVDLRGRGWSSITGLGTYGWRNHARDVLDVVAKLGADRFDYVGHSMGAFIGLELARRAPDKMAKAVLIDAAGVPEALALAPIIGAVQRLGTVHADADAYLQAVKKLGTITPWSEVWEAHYRYDLVPAGLGVRARTDHAAVLEDMAYGATQHPPSFWPYLSMRTLLVRAARPLGRGFIVSESDKSRFVGTAPRATAVDIDANHYGVMTHADTASAVRSFLS